MNRLERFDSLPDLLRVALQGWQSDLWTALPGYVTKFNPSARTCEVKPTLSVRVRNPAFGIPGFVGNPYDYHELPVLLDCPVIFPSGGGYTLTFPVKPGDECLVIFASRCIDNWWDQGGDGTIQTAENVRMHNLSDGFVLVGVNSRKKVIPNISTTSTQLRSDDGATSVDLANGAVTVTATNVTVNSTLATVYASGGATVNADVQINGNLVVSGSIADQNASKGTLQDMRTIYDSHTHGGVQTGVGNTGTPSNVM